MTWTVPAVSLQASGPLRPGVEVVLTLAQDDGAPVVGTTLTAVQRAGLPGEKEIGAGITDSLGKVRWKPDLPGPAIVYAGDEPVGALAIGAAGPPVEVLVPLVLLALAGGAALLVGLRRAPLGRR